MPKTASRLEDFEVLETIGTGSFGTCRRVRRKADGKVLVWKEIDYGGMTAKEKQLLVQEVNLLRELRHPHIVRYLDRVIDRTEATLYIITELCEGGDLATLITKCKAERKYVEEEYVWKVFHQLLLALEECHKKRAGVHKILHRDLKPANVFLDSNRDVKLGDFGLARVLHHNFSLAKTFVGTPYYMSPEQLDEQTYDERSDLWSLGCLVYELCALAPPFTAPNQHILTAKVKAGRFRRIPSLYSSELQAIIASLLQVESERRPDLLAVLHRVTSHTLQRRPSREKGGIKDRPEDGRVHTSRDLDEWAVEVRKREERLRAREAAVQEREERVKAWEMALQEQERQLKAREKAVRDREAARGRHIDRYIHPRLPLEAVDENMPQGRAVHGKNTMN